MNETRNTKNNAGKIIMVASKYKREEYENIKIIVEETENINIKGHDKFYRITQTEEKPLITKISSKGGLSVDMVVEELYVTRGLTFTNIVAQTGDLFPTTFTLEYDSDVIRVVVENVKKTHSWWEKE